MIQMLYFRDTSSQLAASGEFDAQSPSSHTSGSIISSGSNKQRKSVSLASVNSAGGPNVKVQTGTKTSDTHRVAEVVPPATGSLKRPVKKSGLKKGASVSSEGHLTEDEIVSFVHI